MIEILIIVLFVIVFAVGFVIYVGWVIRTDREDYENFLKKEKEETMKKWIGK